ncbi:MAG TPA: cation:proton antiporter, partial [Candidatus Krumholzibacteria bacterium]|nr:cation:proton antiporter [Candidatus Krumholzibacteria bacterium]
MLDAFPLLTLAVILVAGVLSGQLARRVKLPAVTGQILAGVVIGPSILDLASIEAIHSLHPITNFALGLIAVAVGNHLNLKRLRN